MDKTIDFNALLHGREQLSKARETIAAYLDELDKTFKENEIKIASAFDMVQKQQAVAYSELGKILEGLLKK